MNKKQLIVAWVKKYKSKISFLRLLILLLAVIAGIFLGSVLAGKDWIKVLTALLTPMVAIAGIAIGVFQWKINQKRLQHELFERRIKLYTVITTHIANGISSGIFTNEEETQFLRDTKHARFIFGKDIADFVDEIYRKSLDLSFFSRREEQLSGVALEKVIENRSRVFKWFEAELNNIQNRFEKYLQL